MKQALAGLRAYQEAPREERAESMPAVATAGRATLRDYGGTGRPVIFVPSLINPPHVLDLTPRSSLLRWLAEQGVRPLLVDWGNPDPAERDAGIAEHVETMLLPLIDAIGPDAALAGYCIGGTMTIAAAQRRRTSGLALIAAPWAFAGFPPQSRLDLVGLWEQTEPVAEKLGLLPMEVLQTSFWRLDPARTIAKFERFATLDPGSEAAQGFVALEDWANDGAPLTLAAGRELLIDLFGHDKTGEGRWIVGGETIDPRRIACPVLNVVSTTDRIVPAATAAGIGDRLTLDLGHVGMMVGGRARSSLWEPLAHWLSQLHKR